MVIVYSVEECPWCHKVKKYLDKLQVGYEERNIDYNEEYVVGFDKEKLDKLLCL